MRPSAPHRRRQILVSFLTIIFVSTNMLQVFANHLFTISVTSAVKGSTCHRLLLKYCLVHAFVYSKFGSLQFLTLRLTELHLYLIKKLQQVQNAAARLITLSRKHEHITPILCNLHWLPINYRIIFKILLITYKALNNQEPSYVRDLLTPYTPSRQLRS